MNALIWYSWLGGVIIGTMIGANMVLDEHCRVGPRNVVITGSTRGLGKALAREFLLSGDRMVVTSRRWSSPESVHVTDKELEENLKEGLVVPDVPLEETEILRREALKNKTELVLLTTPTTPTDRMKAIVEASEGFVYLATTKVFLTCETSWSSKHVIFLLWSIITAYEFQGFEMVVGSCVDQELVDRERETYEQNM